MKPSFLSLIRVLGPSLSQGGEISTIWGGLKNLKRGLGPVETLILAFGLSPMAGWEFAP